MFNLGWGIVFVIVNFVLFLLCYRLFGKKGLYAWVGFATLMANIQVVKTIEVLGIVMTLGNTIYATVSMTTDLLNEKFGQKAAKHAVWIGFFSLLISTIMLQMVLVFEPQAEDIAQAPMETLFGLMPRLASKVSRPGRPALPAPRPISASSISAMRAPSGLLVPIVPVGPRRAQPTQ